MENLVEVRGLTKRYRHFTLDRVDLTVPAGMIVGLIGENGAGKTTTIKAIVNAVRPDSGEVRLLGGQPGDRSVRAGIGVVFEDSYFYGGMTVGQIDRVMAGIQPNWDSGAFQTYCRRFGLEEKKAVKDFSRGMRMKVSLATALSHHPRLLILDEATSGLDPVVRGEILDLFLEFIQDENRGILLSSHITADLERIADQIAYLRGGKMVFQKDKGDLLEDTGVLRCGREMLKQLPEELLIAWKEGAMGISALVRRPAEVRRLLPGVVVDRTEIDEMMQLMAGRDDVCVD